MEIDLKESRDPNKADDNELVLLAVEAFFKEKISTTRRARCGCLQLNILLKGAIVAAACPANVLTDTEINPRTDETEIEIRVTLTLTFRTSPKCTNATVI